MLEYDYPDLKPLTAGASFNLLFSTLYYAHLLRYSTTDLLKQLTGSVKIATRSKMQTLVELGYLNRNDKVFKTTAKTLDLLEKQGYNRRLLPRPVEGWGAELYNSEAICKLLQHKNYRSFLYPHFQYVIPDGLLVLQDGDRYQLNFIEVEADKANHQEYLENKRQGYERLARDPIVFKYWQGIAPHLNLPCPKIEDFRFGVWCYSSLSFSWNGWRWFDGHKNP